jgi:phage FluMu protein Com
MSNNKTEMNTEYDMDNTWVCEILCKKCNKVLPPHTMSEHLDITNCIHCCETGHLYKPLDVFVDTNKPQRMDMYEKYYDVLSRLVGTGKGSRLRSIFVSEFRRCAMTTFTSWDNEYDCINKFGRGMWSENIVKAFKKEIQDIIVKEIAVAFGAFQF